MLERTGYRRELESSTDPQELARLDNLNELVSVAHEFSTDQANAAALDESLRTPEDEDVPDTGVLAAFLERVSLVADTDEIPEHAAGLVTLMTLHTAKGLEFPVVFVTGWEDGMFPHMRALDDPTELSEERRLAYVGHHPGPAAAVCEPGHRPVLLGAADAQPGIAVPARDPAGAHRLAAHRTRPRRSARR